MKYCSKCKKVYPDDVLDCACLQDGGEEDKELLPLPVEPICEHCGTTRNLLYIEHWTCKDYTYGNMCECLICRNTVHEHIAPEEAMKYLILDNYRDETSFCEDKQGVEEYLEYYLDDPSENHEIIREVVILKLELATGKITVDSFKPPQNTHLVFWDGETYRVEQVITPEIDFEGYNCAINW